MELKQKGEDPYKSPQSPQAGGPNPPAFTGTMDLGAALQYPFKDPGWFGKVLLVGLMYFIPILGVFIMMGWMRRVFEGARDGAAELPSVDFGGDLSLGVAPFLSMLSITLPVMAVMFVLQILLMPFALLASELGDVGGILVSIVGLLFNLLMMVVTVGMQVAVPEVWRRGMNGENWPAFSPKASIAAIRNNASAYFMVVVGFFVCGIVSGLGMLVCIGFLLTVPLSWVMMAHLLAQWDGFAQKSAVS